MSFFLPNPTVPTNGQALDATPLLANLVAIEQAIDSFDGSQLQAKSVTEQALADAINPRLINSENMANHVNTGCVWSGVSGLTGTMSAGVIYVNGYRQPVTGIGSEIFPASSDTYVYIDYLGNVTYQSVSNNANSPSATANAILVAIVITGSSSISSVNQGSTAATTPVISGNIITVQDSLGNLIYPSSTSGKLLGYRNIISTIGSLSSNSPAQIAGLSCPVIIPANRNIKISMGGGFWENNTSNVLTQQIWGGTVGSGALLGYNGVSMNGSSFFTPFGLDCGILTSSGGSTTINAAYFVNTAAVGIQASTGTSWLRVELE